MLRRLAAAALMLLASAGIAIAETTPLPRSKPEVCARTLDATRARIASLEARGAVTVLMDIEGEAAETWIAMFNALPPPHRT